MSDKIIENNQVTIMGEVASQFTFSHEVFGEGFYMVEVLVKRLSNSDDRIPLMISERLIDVHQDYTGEYIMVTGQFRSYNHHDEQKNRLVLSVFVREVTFVEEELDGAKTNSIFLDGYICKGRNARFASGFEVGEHVQILGRIQSREYIKKLTETETQKRIAYEVSVSKLECVEE